MLDFSDMSNSNELRIAKFPSSSTQGDEPKPFLIDSNPSSESRQQRQFSFMAEQRPVRNSSKSNVFDYVDLRSSRKSGKIPAFG